MNKNKLYTKAEALVRERIGGFRKGTTDVSNWTHSIRVAELLEEYGCTDEVVIAGLLHDVVEDGGVTLDELSDTGFSERIVELVDLCSHSLDIKGSEKRWMTMMARLVEARDRDAWLIKTADLLDNLRSCHTMPREKQVFMRDVKGRIFLSLSKNAVGSHKLRGELKTQIQYAEEVELKKWYVEVLNLETGEVLWHYYLQAREKDVAQKLCMERFIVEQQDDLLLDTGGLVVSTIEEDTWEMKDRTRLED